MNNATSIALRSAGLCSRSTRWPASSQWLRRTFQSCSKSQSLLEQAPLSRVLPSAQPISKQLWTKTFQRQFATAHRSCFEASSALHRLKPYDDDHEDGLTFRDKALSERELARAFGASRPDQNAANRLLKVLHARRVDGTLDIPLDEELQSALDQYPELQTTALEWLRVKYPVDEDAAILARFQREEAPRVQESPSALMERGQKLGLFKTQDQSQKENPDYYGPQSGQYYAGLSEKDEDVFGRSQLDSIRAKNEAEAEEEEKRMQAQIDKSMAEAEAKAKEKSQALAERPEQSMELSESTGQVRPPNEFEKWIIRARQRAESDLTLESAEIKRLTSARRILPSLLFVLAACGGLYLFTQYWEPPRRVERFFPNMTLAYATCTGILAANVLVFAAWRFPPALKLLNTYFVVIPAYPYMLSMLGNTFSQTTSRHLLMNMLGLYIFGPSLHEDVGRANFIAIYLASGLLGSLVSLSSYVLRGVMITSSMGASGCIWGITSAYLWIHKDADFSFIFIPQQYKEQLQAKGWMFLGAFVIIDTFAAWRKKTVDVAAHLTGMVVGVITSSLWVAENDVKKPSRPGILGG